MSSRKWVSKEVPKKQKQYQRKKKQAQQNQISPEIADSLLTKISIHRGSITDLRVDCIVNAANGGLWAGAGVCGAIFRAAGYSGLQDECEAIIKKYGNIPDGESVLTKGYRLYAKHIIHSVGPTSQNVPALESCYKTALDLCILYNIRSIAFPCISTGIFGFSKQIACPKALKIVRAWLMTMKSMKYKDYKKLLLVKQKQKMEEAKKRKKNRYRYFSKYHDDDSEDEDENNDEWEDEEDKDKNNKDETDKNTKNDKLEEDDDVDINTNSKEQNNDDDDDAKIDESVTKDNDDTNENKDNNDNDDDETVFDRIDDIIFCCFDIGNWRLYQDNTPKIFPSTQDDYDYEWSNKLKQRASKKKAKSNKQNKIEDDMDIAGDSQEDID